MKEIELEVGEALTIMHQGRRIMVLNMETERPPYERDINVYVTPGELHPEDKKGEYYIIVRGQK